MTLTTTERESLWHDWDALARRKGGIASRETFDAVCDFAAVGDADATRALLDVYRHVTVDLIGQQKKGQQTP